MGDLPIMSVSGIRGVVNETLDEYFFSSIAFLQTRLCGGGSIVIGRDTRPSGEMFMKAACRGIRAAGGKPVDIGIAPTPTTCVAVGSLKANGGIIITASHNPVQYNGYKMVHAAGRLFRGSECEEVYQEFKKGEIPSQEEFLGYDDSPEERVDATYLHIRKIVSQVNVPLIASKKLRIAIDSINGAAGAAFPELLKQLSVEWKGVHNKLDGDFVHNPEPRPEHLGDLRTLLKSDNSFHGGFVFDPDADRLATMGEDGQEISEEMTLVFALQNILEQKKSDIVTNLSTSMVIDDVAEKFGQKVFRTKIGEANVVEGMERHGSIIGGEGNGGVIYPSISNVRDGIAAMAMILELMAKTDKTIWELKEHWPTYPIVKEKIDCDARDPKDVIARLTARFSDENVNLVDGLKIIRDYGWVHLRASNTEPIIRCYAEAKTDREAQELAQMVIDEVEKGNS